MTALTSDKAGTPMTALSNQTETSSFWDIWQQRFGIVDPRLLTGSYRWGNSVIGQLVM